METGPSQGGAELHGNLAECWQATPDGLGITFKMRAGRTFGSGNPSTAEDAAFSLQRDVGLNKPPVSSSSAPWPTYPATRA